MNLEQKTTIFASGHYLCNQLPEDYQDMDEEDLFLFIEGNRWEPFENYDAGTVMAFIDGLAGDLRTHLRQGYFKE